MSSRSAPSGALEAIDRVLNRGGDGGAVLTEVVDILHDRGEGYRSVAIYLVRGDELVIRAWQGREPPAQLPASAAAADVASAGVDAGIVPVHGAGRLVGAIRVDVAHEHEVGDAEAAALRRVAVLISAVCAGTRSA